MTINCLFSVTCLPCSQPATLRVVVWCLIGLHPSKLTQFMHLTSSREIDEWKKVNSLKIVNNPVVVVVWNSCYVKVKVYVEPGWLCSLSNNNCDLLWVFSIAERAIHPYYNSISMKNPKWSLFLEQLLLLLSVLRYKWQLKAPLLCERWKIKKLSHRYGLTVNYNLSILNWTSCVRYETIFFFFLSLCNSLEFSSKNYEEVSHCILQSGKCFGTQGSDVPSLIKWNLSFAWKFRRFIFHNNPRAQGESHPWCLASRTT